MRDDIYRPFDSAVTTAVRIDGVVSVIPESYKGVETSPCSSRFLARDGKLLDVSYYMSGVWLVFEEG